MVAQLRAFTGIEAWLSTEPDVAALKDAAKKLDDTLWADETGPPPPQRNLLDDSEMVALDGVDGGNLEMEAALTSEPALAAQPAPSTSPPAPPAQSTHHGVDTTVNQLVYQPTVQNTLVKNTARLGDPSQDGEPLSSDFQRRGHRGAAHCCTTWTKASRTTRTKPSTIPQELPEPPVPDSNLGSFKGRQEPLQPEPPVPPVPVPESPLEPGWESVGTVWVSCLRDRRRT